MECHYPMETGRFVVDALVVERCVWIADGCVEFCGCYCCCKRELTDLETSKIDQQTRAACGWLRIPCSSHSSLMHRTSF